MNTAERKSERERYRRPAALACSRNARSSRGAVGRSGARQRSRACPPLRAGARGAGADHPSQRVSGCAVGARHGRAVRQDRRRAGAACGGLVQSRRASSANFSPAFRRALWPGRRARRRWRSCCRPAVIGGIVIKEQSAAAMKRRRHTATSLSEGTYAVIRSNRRRVPPISLSSWKPTTCASQTVRRPADYTGCASREIKCRKRISPASSRRCRWTPSLA